MIGLRGKTVTNKQELIDEVTAYMNHAVFAADCLTAYLSIHDLMGDDSKLNKSPGFFTISLYSLSKCLLLELAKLYCGSGNERTIYKLEKIIKANNQFFSAKEPIIAVTQQLEEDLLAAENTINKLHYRRDKDLAHNDPKYFSGALNPAEGNYISPDECWKLIGIVADYCNEILSRLDNRTIFYPTIGSDDLAQLVLD